MSFNSALLLARATGNFGLVAEAMSGGEPTSKKVRFQLPLGSSDCINNADCEGYPKVVCRQDGQRCSFGYGKKPRCTTLAKGKLGQPCVYGSCEDDLACNKYTGNCYDPCNACPPGFEGGEGNVKMGGVCNNNKDCNDYPNVICRQTGQRCSYGYGKQARCTPMKAGKLGQPCVAGTCEPGLACGNETGICYNPSCDSSCGDDIVSVMSEDDTKISEGRYYDSTDVQVLAKQHGWTWDPPYNPEENPNSAWRDATLSAREYLIKRGWKFEKSDKSKGWQIKEPAKAQVAAATSDQRITEAVLGSNEPTIKTADEVLTETRMFTTEKEKAIQAENKEKMDKIQDITKRAEEMEPLIEGKVKVKTYLTNWCTSNTEIPKDDTMEIIEKWAKLGLPVKKLEEAEEKGKDMARNTKMGWVKSMALNLAMYSATLIGSVVTAMLMDPSFMCSTYAQQVGYTRDCWDSNSCNITLSGDAQQFADQLRAWEANNTITPNSIFEQFCLKGKNLGGGEDMKTAIFVSWVNELEACDNLKQSIENIENKTLENMIQDLNQKLEKTEQEKLDEEAKQTAKDTKTIVQNDISIEDLKTSLAEGNTAKAKDALQQVKAPKKSGWKRALALLGLAGLRLSLLLPASHNEWMDVYNYMSPPGTPSYSNAVAKIDFTTESTNISGDTFRGRDTSLMRGIRRAIPTAEQSLTAQGEMRFDRPMEWGDSGQLSAENAPFEPPIELGDFETALLQANIRIKGDFSSEQLGDIQNARYLNLDQFQQLKVVQNLYQGGYATQEQTVAMIDGMKSSIPLFNNNDAIDNAKAVVLQQGSLYPANQVQANLIQDNVQIVVDMESEVKGEIENDLKQMQQQMQGQEPIKYEELSSELQQDLLEKAQEQAQIMATQNSYFESVLQPAEALQQKLEDVPKKTPTLEEVKQATKDVKSQVAQLNSAYGKRDPTDDNTEAFENQLGETRKDLKEKLMEIYSKYIVSVGKNMDGLTDIRRDFQEIIGFLQEDEDGNLDDDIQIVEDQIQTFIDDVEEEQFNDARGDMISISSVASSDQSETDVEVDPQTSPAVNMALPLQGRA